MSLPIFQLSSLELLVSLYLFLFLLGPNSPTSTPSFVHKMRFNSNILVVAVVWLEVVFAKVPIAGTFTGINAATGERPARRDITEMRNDVPTL